jgi:hypothetical protein
VRRWAGDAARASLSPGARGGEDKGAGFRAGRGADGVALSGCALAVVTGGAIVADEVIEQVEGGGDGLF